MSAPLTRESAGIALANAASRASASSVAMFHVALAIWERNKAGADRLDAEAQAGYTAFAGFMRADMADEIDDADHDARLSAAESALERAMKTTRRADDWRRASRRAATAAVVALEEGRSHAATARGALETVGR